MTCPQCNGRTEIYDSRHEDDAVNRKRQCRKCGFRFQTIEIDKDYYERLVKKKDDDFRFRTQTRI